MGTSRFALLKEDHLDAAVVGKQVNCNSILTNSRAPSPEILSGPGFANEKMPLSADLRSARDLIISRNWS